MPGRTISPWKKMPFVKLLLPLMLGIVIQWYLQITLPVWQFIFLAACAVFISFTFLSHYRRYSLASLNGFFVCLIFVAFGALLVWKNDIRRMDNWYGKLIVPNSYYALTLIENPVEKTKSFKANARVDYVVNGQQAQPASGGATLYFSKDSFPAQLREGSVIILNKSLQEIKNTGNPGGFDYKRYCLFRQITHQVYLKQGEYVVPDKTNQTLLSNLVNAIRKKVLAILTTYIPGGKEQGLAEALLIGYKDDLDKNLVQSYSNTGVVHIIAISGLHLGLIYWLLIQLLKPLQQKKQLSWLKPVLVIAGLWLFSLLAGAQPSVLRSAVMFSCLALGESMGRRSFIYNSLAASAFVLLCYNPYWLWDVGFQLSYAAVLSIVLFMRPVYGWLYVKNKALDFIWKMNAVTLAAQILTLPLSLYHFHQFPNYFLFTNFIVVPLSSVIVLGEILLCIIWFIQPVAILVGKILYGLIRFMNAWVQKIEAMPFSLWDGLQISFLQMVLLTSALCLFSFWLMEKNKAGFIGGLITLILFTALRSVSFIQIQNQHKIIVYNIPQRNAIDMVQGRNYRYIGDPVLDEDDLLRNIYLTPSRVLNRTLGGALNDTANKELLLTHGEKHILLIDRTVTFKKTADKPIIDLLILSKSPRMYIAGLADNFIIKQVVFDASVPAWKRKYWKNDCDSLNIPNYAVSEKGAFVMNLR